jgi:hypothetical protein
LAGRAGGIIAVKNSEVPEMIYGMTDDKNSIEN